jgi:hypothetical protein
MGIMTQRVERIEDPARELATNPDVPKVGEWRGPHEATSQMGINRPLDLSIAYNLEDIK